MLDTSPLFSNKPVGEPAVVLHRFGGSYGAAEFLLTATQEEMEGEIRITLVNGWGVPVKVLNLNNIRVSQEAIHLPRRIDTLELEISGFISEAKLFHKQNYLSYTSHPLMPLGSKSSSLNRQRVRGKRSHRCPSVTVLKIGESLSSKLWKVSASVRRAFRRGRTGVDG
jgi:hypothetical protein